MFRNPSPRQAQGHAAETRVLGWLEKRGYRFLQANYQTPLGELDLVMEKGDTVVFVEVRERRSAAYGYPAETVQKKKQARVGRAALSFVKARGWTKRPLRFDVVSVMGDEIDHIENAFVPGGYYL